MSIFSEGSELESARGRHELKGQGYSERDEKRILNALGRGLLTEFPNPERAGCPGRDVLRRIASHEMPLTEAEKWLDHLTSCSPCYRDFSQLQNAQQLRRKQAWLAIAAGILLAVALMGWALLHIRSENPTAQTAVLDLRDRGPSRGAEVNSNEPPLELPRRVSKLKILLPLGSVEGAYDLRIASPSGEALVETSGIARASGGVTILGAALHLNSLQQGKYLLQIRRRRSEWASYTVVLR